MEFLKESLHIIHNPILCLFLLYKRGYEIVIENNENTDIIYIFSKKENLILDFSQVFPVLRH